MPEDKKTEDAPKAPVKKKSNKMLFIIIGVVLLGGGGGAAMMMKGGAAKAKTGEEAAAVDKEIASDAEGKGGEATKDGEKPAEGEKSKEGEKAGATPAKNLIYKFHGADATHEDKFVVNLIDPKGRLFLQASMQLEASSAKALKLIEENEVPLRDAVIMLVSSKTREEIDTPAGKERFKRELLARIDGILEPKAVSKIYLTDWLVMTQ